MKLAQFISLMAANWKVRVCWMCVYKHKKSESGEYLANAFDTSQTIVKTVVKMR